MTSTEKSIPKDCSAKKKKNTQRSVQIPRLLQNDQIKQWIAATLKLRLKSFVKRLIGDENNNQNLVKESLFQIRRLFTLNDYQTEIISKVFNNSTLFSSTFDLLVKQYNLTTDNGANFGNESSKKMALSALKKFEKNTQSLYRPMHSLSRKLYAFAFATSMFTGSHFFGQRCKHNHIEKTFFKDLIIKTLINVSKRVYEHEKAFFINANK